MTKMVEGEVSAKGVKFGIIVSRFNDSITRRLHTAALECLAKHGAAKSDVETFSCAGSFEIPQVADQLASTRKYDALICLGCVIRGETPHFEYIAAEVTRGVGHVARTSGVPISFGVLTTETSEQALERSGGKAGNKGWDAALSAIEMANLFKRIRTMNRARSKKVQRSRKT